MSVRRTPGTALAVDTTIEIVYTPCEGEKRIRDLLANWAALFNPSGAKAQVSRRLNPMPLMAGAARLAPNLDRLRTCRPRSA